jgi:hypothetical protein
MSAITSTSSLGNDSPSDDDPGLAERVAWWHGCDATAQTLGRALGVPQPGVCRNGLRAQLVALGLVAADDDHAGNEQRPEGRSLRRQRSLSGRAGSLATACR